jgi:type II secretion system protein J
MMRSHRSGFTLLELLISMTIVAVLAVLLASSLAIAFKTRSVAEKSVETSRSAEMVMEFLRADLQCALPPSRGKFAGSFSGTDGTDERGNEADDLVFYTTAPSPLHPEGANGEIKQIEITSYLPDNGITTSHMLVVRTLNNLLSGSVQENPDEEVLLRNVYGFNVRYFDGTDWQDNWDSGQYDKSLPQAVEVALSLETPDKNPDGSPHIAR